MADECFTVISRQSNSGHQLLWCPEGRVHKIVFSPSLSLWFFLSINLSWLCVDFMFPFHIQCRLLRDNPHFLRTGHWNWLGECISNQLYKLVFHVSVSGAGCGRRKEEDRRWSASVFILLLWLKQNEAGGPFSSSSDSPSSVLPHTLSRWGLSN